MNLYHLRVQLERVAARYRTLRFRQMLAIVWLLAAVFAVAFWIWRALFETSTPMTLLVLLGAPAVLALVAFLVSRSLVRNDRWVARQIDTAFPELHTCVSAAIEQRPELQDGRFGFLQTSVIRQAVDHARHHDWSDAVPSRSFALAALANVASLALLALVSSIVWFNLVPVPKQLAAAGIAKRPMAEGQFSVHVEPGDVEVERGTSLLIMARVKGVMPSEASLVHRNDAGDETRLGMSASLQDPVFGGRIDPVNEPLAYHVELEGHSTPTYKVTVFEYPRLERADAKLKYPDYTGMEERLVQDVRTLSVVEGTQLALTCRLNKAVQSATLAETRAGLKLDPIMLTQSSEDERAYQTKIECTQSLRLRLDLVDAQGRTNKKPAMITINVVSNQPAHLEPTFPAHDLEVSALEELDLKATLWDDYGVKRAGLSYSLAGQPAEIVLLWEASAKTHHALNQVVSLEDLRAEPDQLLSYYWWAEDVAPDGQVRRTQSDMYFAEARPFDEVYRQGQQPPGGGQQPRGQGQSQNEQSAEQLSQLQKDIINATWNLIRRESAAKPSAAFAADAENVRLSQQTARERAEQLAERVQDDKSREFVAAVLEHMDQAIKELTAAHAGPATAPLNPALLAEQAAYQALLKLRAREHEIVRQMQGQQRGNNSARSQQQREMMRQLDLRNEANRYETQRSAEQQQEETAEEKENRQVLNRLRELARRQHDLNQRMKELQAALQEAKTEQQREELRRQLQRLQEEQRELLQDTDELASRLEEGENAERFSQERQQLDETREQVRKASEALAEDKTSQAVAAGTRAEQQFEELREELRRRAAQGFREDVQRLRTGARELDEKQQELSRQMSESASQQERRLSGDDKQRNENIQQLREQRARLNDLQDQMRDVIERAEATEPLLSQKLYDAVRDVQDHQVDKALEATERSLRQGFVDDAQAIEAAAGKGIRELRESVEQAADAVVGDGAEALRRARSELEQLSRELNDEIRRNSPEENNRGEQAGGQPSDRQDAEPRQGVGAQGEQGQEQQGERQGGRRQGRGEQSQEQNGQPRAGEQGQGETQSQQPGSQQGQSQQGQSQQGQSQQGQNQQGQGQQGQSQGQQNGEAAGGQQGESQQQGQGQPQAGGQGQEGQRGNQPNAQRGQRGPRSLRDSGNENDSQSPGETATGPGGNVRMMSPLGGSDFRNWSDRLRDVEELVDDPRLRADAARIRERARAMRADSQRHSQLPNWDLARQQIGQPLAELTRQVTEELLRRTSKNAILPLDRDPVPPAYSDTTRRYYERLGSGE